MKTKLIFGVIISTLFGCKSSKVGYECYSYVDKDTITIVTEHVNYGGKCHESITCKNVIIDTLYLSKN